MAAMCLQQCFHSLANSLFVVNDKNTDAYERLHILIHVLCDQSGAVGTSLLHAETELGAVPRRRGHRHRHAQQLG